MFVMAGLQGPDIQVSGFLVSGPEFMSKCYVV